MITSGAEFLMSINTLDSSSLVCFALPPPLDPVDMAVTMVVPGSLECSMGALDGGIEVMCDIVAGC